MNAPAWWLLGISLALALLSGGPARSHVTERKNTSTPEQDFLERHWRRPILPQGEPPERFSPVERSLLPADCGTCHPVQLGDWKSSLHSKSMGPGVAGQLVEMIQSDPAGARACLHCHAPLAEQAFQVPGAGGAIANPGFDAGLRSQGIVCAGCHVRGHQRFGPPRRPGAPAVAAPPEGLPHNGFTPSSAFLRSEFCTSCHQFTPDGFTLNGKPLENTFEEWRASPAARRGRHCQDCHMPDRRHLWRGIHDPDMVKSGVQIRLATTQTRYRPGDRLHATLTIASTGVGHDFPTYVTPRVVVRAEMLDATGRLTPGSAEERVIGRDVLLDLSREIADTRIPAGGRFTMKYSRRLDRPGLSLRVTVTVFPDHFYTRFFEALLASGAGQGAAQIEEALEASRRSSFEIFSRAVPLT